MGTYLRLYLGHCGYFNPLSQSLHGGRKRPHGWPMVISEFLRFVGVDVFQISKLKRHDQ